MKSKLYKIIPFLVVVLFMNFCASFNKSHTTKFAQQQQLVSSGNIELVAANLERKARRGGREGVLYALQAGYYYQFSKNYEKSKELFEVAENQIKEYEGRGVVNVRDIGSNIKAAASSDMELPYKGEIFEKIMLCSLQAMNYLLNNNFEGANVEIRKADIRQKEAVDKHQRELKNIEKQKKEKDIDDRTVDSVMKEYGVLDSYSSQVVNSFQNGFTYYLSGLVYEINQDPNAAYIDYRKSFSLFKNALILEKLIELSSGLEMRDENENWRKMYVELYNEEPITKPEGNGELVVIHFSEAVPQKTQAKFSLWTAKKSFNVAFPFYDVNSFPNGDSYLEILIDNNSLGETKTVVDFIPIVVKALKEKVPGIIIRQAIRLIAKNTMESEARKKTGIIGGLFAKVVNRVTERADLRGWYELPANIKVYRSKVEPGAHSVSIQFFSNGYQDRTDDVSIQVKKNGFSVILVQEMTNRTSIHNLDI